MSVTAVPLQPVKRAYKVWLWLGVLLAVVLAFGLAWLGTREQVALKGADTEYLAWNKGRPGVQTTASGLQFEVLKAGDGATAGEGDYVIANYEGRFRDGTVFDKSTQPVPFPIQQGSAIPGFLEGLKLMQKGGKYRLWIPADLAYGAPGMQSPDPERVPPDAMLVFTVSPERIIPAAVVQQMMMQRAMQQQQQQQGGGAGAGAGSPPQGVPGQ
ncbi:FKBP-type peptidyl-prolyl cis-trans isomerase FkpA [Sphingomonas naasensis]|uniref:Peptidyl-prolyl cis-trans isomerase n=1 Tax=Sphingomonas naasensis TaxID=1344951 RepID=A0A4S1WVQ5_9SPHN|nr:FKBP-type peptidyl-prolyl cis-trans isomerase [Sphingomonas naasensis]NIJ19325.1 FKBP-type peptidyl-prolyl cis-trans isomerase FkpA [Sphingomonas naasensis]TGX46497.1 FKBP-type peptidylprolyl isomerase [Sphingomonas naasensis]